MGNYDIIPSDREISVRQTKETLLGGFPCKAVPCDWLMMTCFYHWDLPRNKELAQKFKEFVDEYYHDFSFATGDDAYKALRSLIFYYDNYYAKVFGCGIKTFCSKKQVEEFEKALTFGAILRDFMIKSMGYSVINHDNKEVITSNNEDDRLADCLDGGYSLDYKQPVNLNSRI